MKMGSGYDSSTVNQSGMASGLQRNLDLIRKYGTDKDKDCLRGSGMAGNRPLSKTFYDRLKKAGERMG